MSTDRFQKQFIRELEPAGELSGDVHHQKGKKGDVFVVELMQQAFGKDNDLAVFHGDGGNGVLVDAHQGHLSKTLTDPQPLFLDYRLFVWNEQFDEAALDDVDAGGFIPFAENELPFFDDAALEAAEYLVLPSLANPSKDRDLREDGNHLLNVFQGKEVFMSTDNGGSVTATSMRIAGS